MTAFKKRNWTPTKSSEGGMACAANESDGPVPAATDADQSQRTFRRATAGGNS